MSLHSERFSIFIHHQLDLFLRFSRLFVHVLNVYDKRFNVVKKSFCLCHCGHSSQ